MTNKLKSTIGNIADIILAIVFIGFIIGVTIFITVNYGIIATLKIYGIIGFLIFIGIASKWSDWNSKENKPKFVEVEVEIPNDILLQAMILAHEANMTFNEWANAALEQYMKHLQSLSTKEIKSKFQKKTK